MEETELTASTDGNKDWKWRVALRAEEMVVVELLESWMSSGGVVDVESIETEMEEVDHVVL